MSRTINTQPYDWQTEHRARWRGKGRRYPLAYGGAWPGRKAWARLRNRQARHAINQQIRMGIEEPHCKLLMVAYDIW